MLQFVAVCRSVLQCVVVLYLAVSLLNYIKSATVCVCACVCVCV